MNNNIKLIFVIMICGLLPFVVMAKTAIAMSETQLSDNSGFDILHYDAELIPSITEQNIAGRMTVTVKKLTGVKQSLVLSAKYKTLTRVSSADVKITYRVLDERLFIDFGSVLKPEDIFTLDIEYLAAPTKGMRFYADHLFTVYHTGNWLVSHANIADKASFDLTLIHDKNLKTIANGQLVSQLPYSKSLQKSHWQQQTPIPIYTFGFALGRFEQQEIKHNNQVINYFYRQEASPALNSQNIADVFTDVPDMITFFEDKSGISLPNKGYNYVVVAGSIAQEAAGFSMVGEKYAFTVLKNHQENWFIAHELAHEWWGNSITCATFSHFWLNEGLVQFMVAAYKEQLFGTAAYHKEIKLAATRVGRVVKAGRNSPLAFTNKITEQEINHSIVYNKGALVFYLLREQLGEDKFWLALKTYSITFKGKSVVTDDLKNTFEQVSGQNLSVFFQRWVYGAEIPVIKL